MKRYRRPTFRIRFLVPKDRDGILQILQRCWNWRSFKEVLPFCSQIIGHFYILFSWISYFNITQYNIWETFCTRGSVSGKYMYQLLHGAHATKFESRYISIGIDWHQLWKYSVLVYTRYGGTDKRHEWHCMWNYYIWFIHDAAGHNLFSRVFACNGIPS
jgi:hypothetical protein